MNDSELRDKWDRRYSDASDIAAPLEVLAEYEHLLPNEGHALDLACGLGGSALWLASRGLQTRAWDLSPVAIDRLRRRANDLPLTAEVRDVVAEPPVASSFDVICVGHFLERDLCPSIAAALRPGGLLFYQTFVLDRVDDTGPRDGPFRLHPNELLRLFSDLTIRLFRDEGSIGDARGGLRNLSQLIAQRVE